MSNDDINIKVIARIHTDFPTKFGVPRQSGLINSLRGKIIFEPEYRDQNAIKGLEEFSHIWLIWGFSKAIHDSWSATVRPPRLGGNTRVGVFATRSPYRPNPVGLSSVKLESIEIDSVNGPVLYVSGIDMIDNTPIYDIKPYISYADCHQGSVGGYVDSLNDNKLVVEFPKQWLSLIPEELHDSLINVLAGDPRPSYQNDPQRIYGFEFNRFEIKFKVVDNILYVCDVETLE